MVVRAHKIICTCISILRYGTCGSHFQRNARLIDSLAPPIRQSLKSLAFRCSDPKELPHPAQLARVTAIQAGRLTRFIQHLRAGVADQPRRDCLRGQRSCSSWIGLVTCTKRIKVTAISAHGPPERSLQAAGKTEAHPWRAGGAKTRKTYRAMFRTTRSFEVHSLPMTTFGIGPGSHAPSSPRTGHETRLCTFRKRDQVGVAADARRRGQLAPDTAPWQETQCNDRFFGLLLKGRMKFERV